MELSNAAINTIINLLKTADGEDVQEILVKSGWNNQMLTQLMMSEPMHVVEHVYNERVELFVSLNKQH